MKTYILLILFATTIGTFMGCGDRVDALKNLKNVADSYETDDVSNAEAGFTLEGKTYTFDAHEVMMGAIAADIALKKEHEPIKYLASVVLKSGNKNPKKTDEKSNTLMVQFKMNANQTVGDVKSEVFLLETKDGLLPTAFTKNLSVTLTDIQKVKSNKWLVSGHFSGTSIVSLDKALAVLGSLGNSDLSKLKDNEAFKNKDKPTIITNGYFKNAPCMITLSEKQVDILKGVADKLHLNQ